MKRACFSFLVVAFLWSHVAYGESMALLFRDLGRESASVLDATSPLSARRSLMAMALSLKNETEFQDFSRQSTLLCSILRDCSEEDFEEFRKACDKKSATEIFPAVRQMGSTVGMMYTSLRESSEESEEPISRELLQKRWDAQERVLKNFVQNEAVFDATSCETLAESLAQMSLQAETSEQLYALFSFICAYYHMLTDEQVDSDEILANLRDKFQGMTLIPLLEKMNQQSDEKVVDELYRVYHEMSPENQSAFLSFQKKYLTNVIETAVEKELQDGNL